MILALVIFFAININLAFIDSRRIRNGKGIAHWMNALVYCVLVGASVWLIENYWLIPLLLIERLIVFQIALSLFRSLKWDYITPDPKAVTDKFQVFLFKKNGKLMYGFYLALFILFIIL